MTMAGMEGRSAIVGRSGREGAKKELHPKVQGCSNIEHRLRLNSLTRTHAHTILGEHPSLYATIASPSPLACH